MFFSLFFRIKCRYPLSESISLVYICTAVIFIVDGGPFRVGVLAELCCVDAVSSLTVSKLSCNENVTGIVPFGGAGGKREILIVFIAVNTCDDGAALGDLVHKFLIWIVVIEVDVVLIIEKRSVVIVLGLCIYNK